MINSRMIGGPRDTVHWRMPERSATGAFRSACGLESFTLPSTQESMNVTCQRCLDKLEEGSEFK